MSSQDSSSVGWRKSTHSDASGGDCVEVAAWRKGTRSGSEGGISVEVAGLPSGVAVRDSKDPDGARLRVGRRAFGTLLAEIRAGRYDR
ncbi:DUF397 domain-containing protein [Actinomadura graeca]|uniref:DUF397 domain-containing protein n=1 Tax=Actinomadura graeca TaxID=2750812 RepID=A0ABX8R0J1_9ACTN|nr:DUF397 domain-containing protein [Actinomadura graeca]QXJ24527.1 DUF397 domain-containing protein [Actinomadura graeca]